MGSSWLAGELWERLGIAAGILKVATDRRVDAELVERVIFSMVANRLSVKPLSKLAGCTWVRQRAFVEGLTDVSDDACYPAMDVLIGGIAQLHKTGFFSVANLLNLEVDLLFFDTTSTYWESDRLEEDLDHGADDNDESLPHAALHERDTRVYNSASKDHRPDLPQVVLGMAVTRQGIPVRVWTFGGAESDQVIIKKVEDDLGSWNLSRVIWVLDRGFTSAENQRAEYYGALSTKPTYKRFLRRTASGKPRIDRAAVAREAKLDRKSLLRTSDKSLSAEDIALGYKALYEAERGWRDIKSTIDLRPVYHHREDRIRAHVQLCWLALIVLRVAAVEVGDTWRNIRNELDRMHLVTFASSQGTLSQRSELTPRQREILCALKLSEPPRFYDFTPASEPPGGLEAPVIL